MKTEATETISKSGELASIAKQVAKENEITYDQALKTISAAGAMDYNRSFKKTARAQSTLTKSAMDLLKKVEPIIFAPHAADQPATEIN